MDRASDSGSEGWGFESLPAYQTNKRDTHTGIPLICSVLRTEWDSKIINATVRWTVAADGSTEANITICLRKIARVPSGMALY